MVFRQPSKQFVALAAALSSLAVTVGACTAVAVEHKTVSIEVNGVTKAVSTFGMTVGDVLAANGVSVGVHDEVTPALGDRLHDGETIAVQSAQSYRLTVDGETTSYWSTADSLYEVAQEAQSDYDTGAFAVTGVAYFASSTSETNVSAQEDGDPDSSEYNADAASPTDSGADSDSDYIASVVAPKYPTADYAAVVTAFRTSVETGTSHADTADSETDNAADANAQRRTDNTTTAESVSTVTSKPVDTDADLTGDSIDDLTGVYLTYDRNSNLFSPMVSEAMTLTVIIDGESTAVELVGGESAERAVALAGYELQAIDEVQIGYVDGEICVQVQTVTRSTYTKTQEIEYETVEEEDPTLPEGERSVTQEGETGTKEVTVYEYVRGGETVLSTVLSETITKQPVTEIVAVGTGEEVTKSATSTSSASSSDVWAQLAQCESSGNPTAVSADGLYYGLYQFSLPTWRAMGGTGLPSEADEATQTALAQKLQAQSGWGQWPACAAKLGLL